MHTYLLYKRFIDVTISIIILIILLPVFIFLGALIKVDSKGPILFKQKRITKNKKHFYIFKFRTMKTETPKEIPTHLLRDSNIYITKLGKILRKTSLDELPQIFNVIKGDMSLIGPRPALWNQNDLIEERDKYGANDILPGITGWAQINGRDELPIDFKAKLDGEYVKRMNLFFDMKILYITSISAFRGEGVVEGQRNIESKV